MIPYEIKQRPGKTILSLFLIMLVVGVERCSSVGECDQACFGPVSRLRVYNERDGNTGMVHVHKRNVVADENGGFLYKIAKGATFYLYDPAAEKFICWKKSLQGLVARRYKKYQRMHLCEFKDAVSQDRSSTHVELHYAHNDTIKMKFNRHGNYAQKCKRRKKRKCEYPDFLIKFECCPEARELCCSSIGRMREMHEICRHIRSCQNDTLYP